MKTLLMVLALSASLVQAKSVDVAGKEVKWTGGKIVGDSHHGTIKVSQGKLELSETNTLTGGKITFDMNSIKSKDLKGESAEKLDGHLKSDDFFAVKKHPKAVYNIKKVEKLKGDKVKLSGDLTIKGTTKPYTFTAIHSKNTLAGEMNFDRSKWDIKYGSKSFFDLAKDKVIKDDIQIAFNFNLK